MGQADSGENGDRQATDLVGYVTGRLIGALVTTPVTGLISWCPQLGKPLGKIRLQPPLKQDDLLSQALPEIWKEILTQLDMLTWPKRQKADLLTVCRTWYQKISPFCKWIDIHAYQYVIPLLICNPSS